MIEHPHPLVVPVIAPRPVAQTGGADTLSAADVQRLVLFKWRYALAAGGFDRPSGDRLMFLRWLRQRHPTALQ